MQNNGVDREDSSDAPTEEVTKKRGRGPTVMHEITRDSSVGQRRVIEYNEDGQPIGVNATKLKSFIGMCVRHHVPIIYDNWKMVPSEIKEKIYNLIKDGFVVDPRSKKNILQNAGTSFRQFKYILTTKYVMPFKDNLESLKSPPKLYSHIEQEHWNTFVKSRLNEEFESLSQKNQEMRGKNIYNHRMSRKGYANLAEELKMSSCENLNERCILWKSARMNREGMIVDQQTQEVVTRIDEILTTQAHNFDAKSTTEDVLSLALGTPDHRGQVRGVGRFITPTQYFQKPKPSSRSKVQALKVGVEKVYERHSKKRDKVSELEVLNACTALLGLEKGVVSSKKSRVRSTRRSKKSRS